MMNKNDILTETAPTKPTVAKLDLAKSAACISDFFNRFAKFNVCACGYFTPWPWVIRVCPHCCDEKRETVIAKIVPGQTFFSRNKGASVVYMENSDD